jgi:hypothetical protein
LWVFNPAYRRSLDELGINASLARAFQEISWRAGDDEAAQLYVASNSDDCGRDGTGVFYCVGRNPEVFTLLTPRVHAPTPQNLDGLVEAARITEELIARIGDR